MLAGYDRLLLYSHHNESRPQQGIGQQIPARPDARMLDRGPVIADPVLGRLRHDYRRAGLRIARLASVLH